MLGVLVLERAVPLVRHAEVRERRRRFRALVQNVVNGANRARILVDAVRTVFGRHQSRYQTGVPVVGDEDDVLSVITTALREWQLKRRFARGVGQQSESELVVAVHAVRISVQSTLAVERRMIDEDVIDAVLHLMKVTHLLFATEASELRLDARIERAFVQNVRL